MNAVNDPCCSTPARPFFLPVRDAPGYAVSDAGEVKSLRRMVSHGDSVKQIRSRILKPYAKDTGHLCVNLGKVHGTVKRVHALVVAAFYPTGTAGGDSRHLNHTPSDNRLVNLAPGTRSANMLDNATGTKRRRNLKLLAADRNDIRFAYLCGEQIKSIAARYDVDRHTVTYVLRKTAQ